MNTLGKFKEIKKKKSSSNIGQLKEFNSKFCFDEIEKVEETSTSNKLKIIISDDCEIIRSSFKKLLLLIKGFKEKYDIVECGDGIEILKCLMEDQLIGNKIKAVFTDENMEYMNGSKAVTYLKEIEKGGKIHRCNYFSITAFVDEEHKKSILNSGFDLIITKPITKTKIMEVFKNYNLL